MANVMSCFVCRYSHKILFLFLICMICHELSVSCCISVPLLPAYTPNVFESLSDLIGMNTKNALDTSKIHLWVEGM